MGEQLPGITRTIRNNMINPVRDSGILTILVGALQAVLVKHWNLVLVFAESLKKQVYQHWHAQYKNEQQYLYLG